MPTKELEKYKVRLLCPQWPGSADDKSYTIMKKGSITDLNAIVETFDVKFIKISFGDGTSLRLIRDESAVAGQNVDTYV